MKWRALWVLGAATSVLACSGSSEKSSDGGESTGGTTTTAAGGAATEGGNSGGAVAASGGDLTTGGATAAGTGGVELGSGGTAPSTGGTAVATGGASSTTGGSTPGTGGTAASTGGTAPSTGGTAASTGGTAASTGGTAASTGGTAASTGGTGPSTGGSAPSTGGTAASTGGAATGGVAGSPSTGCGLAGAPTGVQSDRSIEVAGVARSFVLSVPSSYSPDAPMPLVFAWHGMGGSGSLARLYFGVEGQANGEAIFVYPDGLPDADGVTIWDLGAEGVDVALFDGLLSALSSEYCIDSARVFSTGHSYGGFMTNALGCYRANVLRAVAPVAGGPPFGGGASPCDTSIAAWITHGSNDGTVAFSMGEAARDAYLAANGCAETTTSVDPSPCVAYDGCAAGRPVHWCVHELDHDWPPFAAEGIWQFFAQF